MSRDDCDLAGLNRQVRALCSATTPAEVLKLLLESSRLAAPRSALFLVRPGQVKGWGAVGYGPEAAARQRAHRAESAAGWLGRLVATPELLEDGATAPDVDFGQPRAASRCGRCVLVKGRPLALLVAERSGTEVLWSPPLLDLLIRIAELRLELDLARRKMGTATVDPIRGDPSTHHAGSVDSGELVPAERALPVPHPAGEPSPDSGKIDAARRFARLVATDIRLYNEEAVLLGRRQGDLVQRLGEQLGRGKDTFLRRHEGLGPAGLAILHEAYVQVLAAGDERLMPASALD